VISLTLPGDRRYFRVARLVVGALTTRLELSYEQMDDLQLAVETALREHAPAGSTVTLEIAVDPERLELAVGPVSVGPVSGSRPEPAGEGEDELTPRRLLGALVERVEIVERDGAPWIRLEEPIAGGRARLGAS
jgi:hypothetical protein